MKCHICEGYHAGECLYESPTVSPAVAVAEVEPSTRKQRTVTATKRESRVEHHVESSVTITEDAPEVAPPVVVVQAPEISVPEPKLISHVPANPPDVEQLLENTIRAYGDDDIPDSEIDALWELQADLATRIVQALGGCGVSWRQGHSGHGAAVTKDKRRRN